MIILGLTGSIGMGKSTTAEMFRRAGVALHDSDEAVHRLYAGAAAPLIEAAFPGVVVGGAVDRQLLSEQVIGKPEALKRLEQIIHPLVRRDADAFLDQQRRSGAAVAVLDIPLLFETGGRERVDRVVVVSAPADIQRQRVLARPGMTPDKFDAIQKRQTPDAEKRAKADYVVETGQGLESAEAMVRKIVDDITAGVADPR